MTDRQTTSPDIAARPTFRTKGDKILNLVIHDLFDSRTHSQAFNGTRADYINLRIRVIAISLAIITPLWIPVDFLLLPSTSATSMTIMRIAATVCFLLLGMGVKPVHNLPMARLKLVALIGLLSYCNIQSKIILDDRALEGLLVSYSFLPYLTIAIQAIFPLTLRESLAMIVMVMGLIAGLELYLGQLLTLGVSGELWLMGLLSGIAIWAQMTQLHMLLSLYRQATRDPLTGLYNRRAFMERMDIEVERAVVTGTQ